MHTPAELPIRVAIAARMAARRSFGDTLTAAGMLVVAECATTAELIAAVAHERPDVCVLDRELRGGTLAATAALASPGRPKVLVVGGRGSEVEVRAARLAGAAACLPGEVSRAELAAAVTALVREERQ
jgi:DNA-binding NarL/FixJ family response regulator